MARPFVIIRWTTIILQDLLSIMRTPAVKSDLKRRKEVAELQAQMAADRAEEVATQKQEETTAVHTLQNQDEDRYHKALFPSISPLKAAMYFGQDADQLGRWRLFISGRACSWCLSIVYSSSFFLGRQ